MKTLCLMNQTLIFLLIVATSPVWAQEWSFGPKVYFGLDKSRMISSQVQLGANQITAANYGDATGYSLGAFARYDRLHWYVQGELMQGKYSLINSTLSGTAGGFATYPSTTRSDVRLLLGGKLLPWLRLSAGLTTSLNKWKQVDYTSTIRAYQEVIAQHPANQERYAGEIEQYQVAQALQSSYKRTTLEGLLGIGTDIGGLTVDLTYAHSLTPAINEITYQNQTYTYKQPFGYWSLGIGYKLFPIKRHLLAARKNRAYDRIKQDIPFYRNEFHIGIGLSADDIGSQFIYENRYTRYFSRRVGLTTGLSFSHSSSSTDDLYGSLPMTNEFRLLTGIRWLPLYSRRHTIGLTTGPLLQYTDRLGASSGAQNIADGQVVRYINLHRDASVHQFSAGWHTSVDYQFALTDRLITGPWLRVLSQSILFSPDYAQFGVQAGYRF